MTALTVAKQQVCARVDTLAPLLVRVSHAIHAHPETAYREHRASALLARVLSRGGLTVRHPAFDLPTSFTADAGATGPRVVICCEYDALPRMGHACGHNVIAAAGVGAGLALGPRALRLGGRVTILGTPAEEGGGGKIVLARRGAFTEAAAAMLTHPSSYEVVMPHINAVATLDVVMTGKAAHASMYPERGINALDALVLGYHAVAALRQHIPPTDKIHGILTDGGQLPNVVPARAAGRFMVRSADTDSLTVLRRRVARCFRGAAEATGTSVAMSWRWPSYAEMWHSRPLAVAFEQNLRRLGRRPLAPADVPLTRAGSTDMGDVSHLVPAIHPKLAISPPDVVPHSAAFTRWAAGPAADRAVLDAAKAMAMTALDVWLDPGLARAAARDLQQRSTPRGVDITPARRAAAAAPPLPRSRGRWHAAAALPGR